MIGTSTLDLPTIEAIERDEGATGQALLVVVLAAVANGIGSLGSENAGRGLIAGIVAGVLGWIAFSVVAYFIGSTLFGTSETSATIGQLLRTLGFARAPQLLTVLGFIPLLGGLAWIVAGIWTLVTSIVALRQALDFSTGRAIGTGIVALIVQAIVLGLIFALLGIDANDLGF
jgi:uncharacterized membrane-anchored protein